MMREAARAPISGGGSSTSSIKRIQRELKEICESPSRHWTAGPVGDDLFEWQFVIRGPPGTDFEGGIYTGRLVLPVNYPLAPPSIMMLTPTGRWEVGKKICLSNSNYHPELWQPAWGIRTMMEALRSHFPAPGDGAIGALDWPSDLRQRLARESLDFVCPPGTKKNRELLPVLTPEELKEEDPEPPQAVPAPPFSPTNEAEDPAAFPEEQAAQSPLAAPAPAPAPVPETVVVPQVSPSDEGLRQRRADPTETPLGAGIEATAAVAPAAAAAPRRRRPVGEAVRTPRRQEPVLLQILKPPRTKRGWLIMVIDLLILVLLVSFCVTLADIIKSPPQLLDAVPSPREGQGN